MLPCGLATGMAGALPQACLGTPCLSRRNSSAPPPTNDTPFAKMLEKFKDHTPSWMVRFNRAGAGFAMAAFIAANASRAE
jgi:hypothetical protein